jgi:hypothetical protein
MKPGKYRFSVVAFTCSRVDGDDFYEYVVQFTCSAQDTEEFSTHSLRAICYEADSTKFIKYLQEKMILTVERELCSKEVCEILTDFSFTSILQQESENDKGDATDAE